METLWQDLRYGLRMLRTQPGFTAAAAMVLALGIGANSAIFSVVNAVLLRPLPYREPGRLAVINEDDARQGRGDLEVSYLNFLDWREQQTVFAEMAAYRPEVFTVRLGSEPAPVTGARVTSGLFATLGVMPAVGRAFLPEEDRVDAPRVAVVSHGFWMRHVGAGSDLSSTTITLDDERYAVIGVMPAGFEFPSEEAEVWTALGATADERVMKNRAVHVNGAVARLASGVTLERAQAEMNDIALRIEQRNPGIDPGHGVRLAYLHGEVVKGVRPALLVLFGAVGFVLLVACVNVGNLLLARAMARAREIAIRAALGGSRWRIVRQLLVESTLLASIGGALGFVLAVWGVDLLGAHVGASLPRGKEIRIDVGVLAFTSALSLLSGLILGLAPALQLSKANFGDALNERSGRRLAGGSRRRLRGSLVVAEVALSLVPLAGAGLMAKSFWRLQRVDPGFRSENLATMTVSLPASKYETVAAVTAFYRDVTERLARLPGAQAASAVSFLPITGSDGFGQLTIEGRPFAPGEAPGATFRRNLPNYFRTMGIPLLRGREFDDRDDGRREKVVIINQGMARRFWRNEDPVGSRIKVGPAEDEPWLTVIGVVGDVKNDGLQAESSLATYEPYAQRPRLAMTLVLRTARDPAGSIAAMRDQVRAAEKDILIFETDTMTQRMASSVASQRFTTVLLGIFGGLALLLAAVGIYGVISYAVAQRTPEIGIRMAVGAQRRDVMRLVIGQGMSLVSIGVAAGLVGALVLGKLSSSFSGLLFEVEATDPATFAAIALLLGAVALLACYLPARRATRVDPMTALRQE